MRVVVMRGWTELNSSGIQSVMKGQKKLSNIRSNRTKWLTDLDGNIESGGEDTALVDAANELNNDLAGAVVI